MSSLGKFARYWLPVVLWLAMIFTVSTNVGSGQHTSRFFKPLLRWLIPGISEERLENLHLIIRKNGHLTEYAALAMLLLRARRQPGADGTRPLWRWALVATTLGLCAVTGAGDEFWQSFWKDRSASVGDVAIDTVGATCGAGFYWLVGKLRKKW
ncbi:MAG: VanZ family protein [Verrucomicrobia bacterium]|nr:VanZ family protein [Verrucomicrobiota bacterium]